MKTLFAVLLALVLVLSFNAARAATIISSNIPVAVPNFTSDYVLGLMNGRTNRNFPLSYFASVGSTGNTNFFVTNLYTTNVLAEFMTNNYLFTTNIFTTTINATTNFNEYNFSTNLFVENSYFEFITNNYLFTTNLFATYVDVTYLTNNYAFITNIYNEYLTNNYLYSTNIYNDYFTNNYSYITNLYVENSYFDFITNNYAYITTLYATNAYFEYVTNNYQYTTNLDVKNLTVQNIYAFDSTITNGLYFVTNSFAGPTNTIDLRIQDQYYDTWTPVHITGFVNKSNYVSQSVVLTLRNLSGTNVSLYLPTGVRDGSGLLTHTLTNGATDFVLSIRYSPASGGHTNTVTRSFWAP